MPPKRIVIADLGGATLYGDAAGNRNELQFDAKKDAAPDATAFRFGVWGTEPVTKISFDLLTGDDQDLDNPPRRSERLMIELAKDDDPSAGPDAAILKVYGQEDPIGAETDRDERLLLALSKAKGLELYVPINAYAGILRGNVGFENVHRFTSDNGRYVFNVQGDAGGHIVVYDTWDQQGDPLPESEWAQTGAIGTIQITPL